MNTKLIPTISGCLDGQTQALVDAHELHAFLGVETPFHKWIQRRIEEYGFMQTIDFIGVDKIVRTEAGFFGQRDKTVQGYYISLDMAKELCMVERNEKRPPSPPLFHRNGKAGQSPARCHPAPYRRAGRCLFSGRAGNAQPDALPQYGLEPDRNRQAHGFKPGRGCLPPEKAERFGICAISA